MLKKIEDVLLPHLKNSIYFYEDVLNSKLNSDIIWLDLGCGHQILPLWLKNAEQLEKNLVSNCRTVIGIDYDLAALRNHRNIYLKVRGDISNLPFENNSFDLITANMVVEHLREPGLVFSEVKRILKPRGFFIIHTPNVLGYLALIAKLFPDCLKKKIVHFIDGRKEENIFLTYYRLNSRKRIEFFAKNNNFVIQEIKMLASSPQFQFFFPLNIAELMWIRLSMSKLFNCLRTNIIAILRKE